MTSLSTNVGGFIQVRHLLDVARGPQPCLGMAVGLKSINLTQYKVSTAKQLKKAVREPSPVVFDRGGKDPFGDEAIPMSAADLVLSDFHVQPLPTGAYHAHATLRLPDGLQEDPEQYLARLFTYHPGLAMAHLDPMPLDDYVLLVPRLLLNTLHSQRGTMHYVEAVGGMIIPRNLYTRQELLEAGYGQALKEYHHRVPATHPA